MVVSIDIKNFNPSRVSIFSGVSQGGGGKSGGNGGGILEDMDGVISLTYKQRLIGFGMCIITGALIVLLSYLSIMKIPPNPRMFVIFFSIGNILVLVSTLFLMGPWSQMKRMFDPVRIVATLVYLVSIALTLYFGLREHPSSILAITFAVIELLAFLWYALSYIPFARSMVAKCCGLN